MVMCGDQQRLPYGIVCKLLADGVVLESRQGWVPVLESEDCGQGIKKLQDLKLKKLENRRPTPREDSFDCSESQWRLF